MKLRALDKPLLIAGGFLSAFSGLITFILGFRGEALLLPGFVGIAIALSPGLLWIMGALLFLFGLYLIGLPHSYRRKKDEFIIQQTADGELRISVHAMDGLVRKVMAARSEMTLKNMEVETRKDHVLISLKVAVAQNISIPLAVASLQRDVKQHLLNSTGVDVREVKVSVDTSDEMAADSPYIMRESSSHQTDVSQEAAPPAGFAASEIKPDEPLTAEEGKEPEAFFQDAAAEAENGNLGEGQEEHERN